MIFLKIYKKNKSIISDATGNIKHYYHGDIQKVLFIYFYKNQFLKKCLCVIFWFKKYKNLNEIRWAEKKFLYPNGEIFYSGEFLLRI